MVRKPWSVGIPLDKKVLDKVEDTSVEQPSLERLAYSQLDKMEAYRAVDISKA